jgi:hypothetical protein
MQHFGQQNGNKNPLFAPTWHKSVNFAHCPSLPDTIFAIKNSMQKINVPILGVTDGSEARAVRDGECCVLHNLTVDKGMSIATLA